MICNNHSNINSLDTNTDRPKKTQLMIISLFFFVFKLNFNLFKYLYLKHRAYNYFFLVFSVTHVKKWLNLIQKLTTLDFIYYKHNITVVH